jgi:hypothetical protein
VLLALPVLREESLERMEHLGIIRISWHQCLNRKPEHLVRELLHQIRLLTSSKCTMEQAIQAVMQCLDTPLMQQQDQVPQPLLQVNEPRSMKTKVKTNWNQNWKPKKKKI